MRGRLLINGNMGSMERYLEAIRPWVLESAPSGRPPQVLLITAAWGQGEFGEGPIRAALNRLGVPSRHEGGFDRQIRNLCAWHVWQAWLRHHPHVAAVDRELKAVENATRNFYLEKTSFHAERIRRAVAFARQRIPGFRLGHLPQVPRDGVRPEFTLSGVELLRHAIARELAHDLADLSHNDERMVEALDDAERSLAARTGLHCDPSWLAERAQLAERILEADAIILFGGDPGNLLSALRFFDLGPALFETLRRGATLCSISAGSLVLCDRIVLYDDNSPDPIRRDFRLYDKGFGLIGGLQVLPHCMDRIHTDDPDNLAYLARRFSSRLCVGLNESSFLQVDLAEPRATSVGDGDGVHVFGPDGVKRRYDRGERVPLG
ncbi:MAG: hypothetical protein EXR79_14540 [Myxococcales bacterium]|nr:hypothetical protein [Myxococcales bacterium]